MSTHGAFAQQALGTLGLEMCTLCPCAWFESCLCCGPTFLLRCTLGVALMAQVLGSLSLVWEIWIEFWVPGCNLAVVGI